ncbi:hypothetical protein [Desertibaculum subflavum]|uniref:hypothetical protein n=1 Tax=Desertibaculum subflavum TaxID=2268458 RepID=UPI0013C4EFB5
MASRACYALPPALDIESIGAPARILVKGGGVDVGIAPAAGPNTGDWIRVPPAVQATPTRPAARIRLPLEEPPAGLSRAADTDRVIEAGGAGLHSTPPFRMPLPKPEPPEAVVEPAAVSLPASPAPGPAGDEPAAAAAPPSAVVGSRILLSDMPETLPRRYGGRTAVDLLLLLVQVFCVIAAIMGLYWAVASLRDHLAWRREQLRAARIQATQRRIATARRIAGV